MHRNTYILVSALAVLAALVIGVNFGKKIQPSLTVSPTPIVTSIPSPSIQSFVDSACGFSLQYTGEFSLMDSASGSAILTNTQDKSQSVVMTCQKNIPRSPLPPEKIEAVTLPTITGASVSAKLYHDSSGKDGAPIDALIFTHPTSKLDVFIAGYGGAFNAILKTIQVIP